MTTRRTRKAMIALPSAGIYTKYERRPPHRSQSVNEQYRVMQRLIRDIESFQLDEQLAKFTAQFERIAKTILRRFVKQEGVPKLDPHLESAFTGHPDAKLRHQIEQKIEEIRAGAKVPNALEVLTMRKRLADAERANDALELLNHARFIPVYVKHAKPDAEAKLDIWHAVTAAFEMGQSYERMRIRSIEPYAGSSLTGPKATRAKVRKHKDAHAAEYQKAYNEVAAKHPLKKPIWICRQIAHRFPGLHDDTAHIDPRTLFKYITPH